MVKKKKKQSSEGFKVTEWAFCRDDFGMAFRDPPQLTEHLSDLLAAYSI